MTLKQIGAVLWVLVLAYGGFYVYRHMATKANNINSPAAIVANQDGSAYDGRVISEIAWKRFPQVKPFELTEKSGAAFDSRSLAGKPFVLSFFFSRCPTICRDLNQQMGRLANRHKDSETTFIGLTVDAKFDTPEVLQSYAESFDVSLDNWLLLTGKQHIITQLARNDLSTIVDGDHHTDDIFLIDRWGRFRDRFDWDDPREMKRFDEALEVLLAEKEPPLTKTYLSRNLMATLPHGKSNNPAWLLDFQLTDLNDQTFYSRDLTGTVWVASFFFSRCGTVCPKQNAMLSGLQPEIFGRKAKLVSITTDPQHDRPEILRPYAKDLGAEAEWNFLTGDETYIQRVGSEFLGLLSHGEHHSSLLAVIDRWGNVRGRFDWQVEGQTAEMLKLIEQLNQEDQPAAGFEVVQPEPN